MTYDELYATSQEFRDYIANQKTSAGESLGDYFDNISKQSVLEKFYTKMTDIDSANTSAAKSYSKYVIIAVILFILFYSKIVLGFDIVKSLKGALK